jgi:hypothetical protein
MESFYGYTLYSEDLAKIARAKKLRHFGGPREIECLDALAATKYALKRLPGPVHYWLARIDKKDAFVFVVGDLERMYTMEDFLVANALFGTMPLVHTRKGKSDFWIDENSREVYIFSELKYVACFVSVLCAEDNTQEHQSLVQGSGLLKQRKTRANRSWSDSS